MPRLAGGVFCLAVLGGLVGLIMWHPWSTQAEPPPAEKPKSEGFASDRFPEPKLVPFDAKRAMGYLTDLCKIGPRMSGTEGMKKQQELLEQHFKPLCDHLTWQRFDATQHSVKKPVPMANLIVSWHTERQQRVILCSHYDTRPHADQETDPRRRGEPFVSANDGASGVALLMELANHMKGLDSSVGVDFVLFDGEEYVFDMTGDEYFLGSKYFAREYRKLVVKNRRTAPQYLGAILLDMVGGKGARFPIEQNSWKMAAPLVKQVWGIAQELRCSSFQGRDFSKYAVEDDHMPLNTLAAIPAVDIIDFDYPHWHRVTDLPENCSGEALEEVAKVLVVWLQRMR